MLLIANYRLCRFRLVTVMSLLNYRLCECSVLFEKLLLSNYRLYSCSILIVIFMLLVIGCAGVA